MEATVIPLPTELTTPPVTKIYFAIQGNQAKPYGRMNDNFRWIYWEGM
jgi:hypothetical protein